GVPYCRRGSCRRSAGGAETTSSSTGSTASSRLPNVRWDAARWSCPMKPDHSWSGPSSGARGGAEPRPGSEVVARVRVTILGSGSSGNAILVESGDTRLLVDAGFSGVDLERRLAAVEIPPESIDALFITHDHSDHTRGMGVLARRWGMPLFLTEKTRAACAGLLRGDEKVATYSSAEPVRVGRLEVSPFLTVHDAVDPVAVTVTEAESGQKLGIATDLGRPTATVRAALQGCHMLVLEANYDDILLRESIYPWSVKSRIASSHGHLSNRAAAELVSDLAHPG